MKITVEFESFEEFYAFHNGEAPAPAPAKKPRAKRRTKAEIEAEKKAAQSAATPEPETHNPLTPSPEPEQTAAASSNETPEPTPEPEPAPAPASDFVDVVREAFKELVGNDYDTALKLVENLGCATFDEIVAAGKLEELAQAIEAAGASA